MATDKFNLIFENMEKEDLEEKKDKKEKKVRTYEGTIEQIGEDFASDTAKFIDDLKGREDLDDDTKEFLDGLKDFVKKNKFLSPEQRQALAKISSGN